MLSKNFAEEVHKRWEDSEPYKRLQRMIKTPKDNDNNKDIIEISLGTNKPNEDKIKEKLKDKWKYCKIYKPDSDSDWVLAVDKQLENYVRKVLHL